MHYNERTRSTKLVGFMLSGMGNDSNLLIVFYVQIMPDDFIMQLHRF
ncbi:putative fimbrial-like protein [Klebsiella pneumoniae]|nr:putative fimbrial-like protein [Klebsiella pneumoniae]